MEMEKKLNFHHLVVILKYINLYKKILCSMTNFINILYFITIYIIEHELLGKDFEK
jgi:hypothetical protein